MPTTWFTADHHFGHRNVIRFCNRPFETVEEMDRTMIDNWNAVVRPDDVDGGSHDRRRLTCDISHRSDR